MKYLYNKEDSKILGDVSCTILENDNLHILEE